MTSEKQDVASIHEGDMVKLEDSAPNQHEHMKNKYLSPTPTDGLKIRPSDDDLLRRATTQLKDGGSEGQKSILKLTAPKGAIFKWK